MTHKEVFYLEKSTYVHLFDVLIKVGVNGVFGGGYFWVFGLICAKTMGDIFLWGTVYMLLKVWVYVIVE